MGSFVKVEFTIPDRGVLEASSAEQTLMSTLPGYTRVMADGVWVSPDKTRFVETVAYYTAVLPTSQVEEFRRGLAGVLKGYGERAMYFVETPCFDPVTTL